MARIFMEDETIAPQKKKVRGVICLDFRHGNYADASFIEQVLEEAMAFVASRMRGNAVITFGDTMLEERRGDNKRPDLGKMKFRNS